MCPPNSSTIRSRGKCCFSKLKLVVVTIFVIMMAIISIAWLAMHPHDPRFRVTSLSMTNFNISDSQVRGRYEVGLTITNPNKIKTEVVFQRVGKLVLYEQEWNSVAAVQQQPMLLEKFANTSVKVDMEVGDSKKNKRVPQVLVRDWNKGVINFNVVSFSVKVRFEAGILPTMDKLFNVRCVNLVVNVSFLSPTKDSGIGKNCYIEHAVRA